MDSVNSEVNVDSISKEEKDSEKPNTVTSFSKNYSECRLWIGNLDSKLREYNLLKMVEKFGPLAEFDFLYHRSGPQNGQPRGYAFVTYKLFEDARKAQKTLDGLEVVGRKLVVKWAHAQDEAKYVGKAKPAPPILSISAKEKPNVTKKMSKESKIAALEAKLKMLEENSGEMSFTPDIGGPSKPTKIIYNYIEQKQKPGTSSGKASSSYRHSYSTRPYNRKTRRK